MKPTREERHNIYKAAKKAYKEDNHSDVGICYYLSHNDANNQRYDSYGQEGLNNFPEIAQHKPEDVIISSYWFNITNKRVRIAIFNQAIKETKPLKTKRDAINTI